MPNIPKVKHISYYIIAQCEGWGCRISDICKRMEEELNEKKALVAGTPILTTKGINKDEFLQITIPYYPNSGDGKIAVKYYFEPDKDALSRKMEIEKVSSDYPISILFIHNSNSDHFKGFLDTISNYLLMIWTETT